VLICELKNMAFQLLLLLLHLFTLYTNWKSPSKTTQNKERRKFRLQNI